jgi:DnaJ-class molecular chaperone with C-terminal Zn finger domain
MADTKLYDVLGVSKNASDLEIKKVSFNPPLEKSSFFNVTDINLCVAVEVLHNITF